MLLTTSAAEFHPMRGHVRDGQHIIFADDIVSLQHTMGGWVLLDSDGDPICEPMPSAELVADKVEYFLQYGL